MGAKVINGNISPIKGFSVIFLSNFSNNYFKFIHFKKIDDSNITEIIIVIVDEDDVIKIVIVQGSNNITSNLNTFL